MVLVGRNYINCIHAVGRAVAPYLVLRPDGQQQCVLFASCCSKDQSGRTSVRPLGEIKPCDALNEAHVFDFDELAPFFFFFFVAITLLLLFG
jgi:hypothetical protein